MLWARGPWDFLDSSISLVLLLLLELMSRGPSSKMGGEVGLGMSEV